MFYNKVNKNLVNILFAEKFNLNRTGQPNIKWIIIVLYIPEKLKLLNVIKGKILTHAFNSKT